MHDSMQNLGEVTVLEYFSNIYVVIKQYFTVFLLLQSVDSYYFYYNLLGNEITSELFMMTDFKPERASIRIRCTREKLTSVLASEKELKVRFFLVYLHVLLRCMYNIHVHYVSKECTLQ